MQAGMLNASAKAVFRGVILTSVCFVGALAALLGAVTLAGL